MRLRGDINVLLLGDPGTAKSQLLKFVEKVRELPMSEELSSQNFVGRTYCRIYIGKGFKRGWFDSFRSERFYFCSYASFWHPRPF